MVLYHLQAIQSLFWNSKEQGIAVIQPTCDQRMDEDDGGVKVKIFSNFADIPQMEMNCLTNFGHMCIHTKVRIKVCSSIPDRTSNGDTNIRVANHQ